MQLSEGQFDRYRLFEVIGDNDDIAKVYLAEDMHIERQVAIRIFQTGADVDPNSNDLKKAISGFEKEIRTISKLDHAYILPLLDYDMEELNGVVLPYLVMPYCKEGSLSTWVQDHGSEGKLPLKYVVKFVREAADALQCAHHEAIIHGNVRPSQFLIRYRKEDLNAPELQLAGFGIAKLRAAFSASSQSSSGNSDYMAPEQRSNRASTQTDQYALAVIAYELLTGCLPFGSSSAQIEEYQYVPLSTHDSQLPSALDEVLQQALSHEPQKRFPSIREFAEHFRRASEKKNETTSSPWISGLSLGVFSTIIFTFLIGSVFNALGILPAIVVSIASNFGGSLGTIWGIVGGVVGALLTKQFPHIWKNLGTLQKIVTMVMSFIIAFLLIGGVFVLSPVTDPYIHQGVLPLMDSLSDDSKGLAWDMSGNPAGACGFKDGAYSVIQLKGPFNQPCIARTQNFNDFVYQIDMKILHGTCAGIILRENTNAVNSYHFTLCRNGYYEFTVLVNGKPDKTPLASGNIPTFIQNGLAGSNLLAVVARNNTFSLYVNKQLLALNVSDSTYTTGHIGVFVYPGTEAMFSNVELWRL